MEGKVIILVIIGTIGVMLMAFSVVFFVLLYKRRMLQNELDMKDVESKHQQDMLSATLKSQEAERNKLGSELHDSVGAMLSSIKMNLQIIKRKSEEEGLDPVLSHLDETISQVRTISHQMMPIVLKKYGLKRAIEDLFEKVSNQELKAELKEWDDFDFKLEDSLLLFRVIQELVNNSLKHAKACEIYLSAKNEKDGLLICYSDNGMGYPEKILRKSEGMGLLNIMNRAQSLGASVTFSNIPDGGAQTDLVIPNSID